MNPKIEICTNRAGSRQIADHLRACDSSFTPPLSSKLELSSYAQKIARKADRFEAWVCDELVGMVAAYCNDAGAN